MAPARYPAAIDKKNIGETIIVVIEYRHAGAVDSTMYCFPRSAPETLTPVSPACAATSSYRTVGGFIPGGRGRAGVAVPPVAAPWA